MDIITRDEAQAIGQKWYFTGVPCTHGHLAKRTTSDRSCNRCKSIARGVRRKHLRDTDENERNKQNAYMSSRYWGNTNRRKRAAELHQERMANDPAYVESRREYGRKRKKENPGPSRSDTRNRRAKQRKAKGSHSHGHIRIIGKMQRWRCAYCRADISKNYHVDHIQPLVRGGSNWPRNLQCLCAKCNQLKSDKDPLTFARQIGLLL